MSLKLLLRDTHQRAFAVVGNSHALVFRQSNNYSTAADGQLDGTSFKASTTKCMVEFTALDDLDFTGFHELHTSTVHGTLGLINIQNDVFLCIISGSTRVATVRSGRPSRGSTLSTSVRRLT